MNRRLLQGIALLVLACAVFVLFLPATRADDTAALYKAKCAMCHKADGSGNAAMKVPDFKSPDIAKKTDKELIESTANGKGKMTPFKGKLTDAQIKDLIAYVRELAKK